MVVRGLYHRPFRIRKRPSNSVFFYEKEIFPAALINLRNGGHVALFETGSVLCTGIKTWREYHEAIRVLDSYLSRHESCETTNASVCGL